MCDVYLGGMSIYDWRSWFKTEISDDISVFDPTVQNYDTYEELEKTNQMARELIYMEKSNIVVFYINELWNGASTLLELGDAVGRGKKVILCLEGNVYECDKIERYCDYRNITLVRTLDDLVIATEECVARIYLCETEDI